MVTRFRLTELNEPGESHGVHLPFFYTLDSKPAPAQDSRCIFPVPRAGQRSHGEGLLDGGPEFQEAERPAGA